MGIWVTPTISCPHSPPADRQQRLYCPGAGETAGVPALYHPGWEALPGEALAQGRPARECWLFGRSGPSAGARRGCCVTLDLRFALCLLGTVLFLPPSFLRSSRNSLTSALKASVALSSPAEDRVAAGPRRRATEGPRAPSVLRLGSRKLGGTETVLSPPPDSESFAEADHATDSPCSLRGCP